MYRVFVCIWAVMFPVWGDISPSVLYLTWQHDPTSTMMIHWHAEEEATQVPYRRQGDKTWEIQEGISVTLPYSKKLMHTVELLDLDADTEYEFCVQEGIYRFRTLPSALTRSVRFVMGGDAYYHLAVFKKMNALIAEQNPDFVVVGGDIAYTCGVPIWTGNKKSALKRWRVFLSEWKKSLVTRDGRLIPLIPVIGNHDIRASSVDNSQSEYLFYELFAFPRQGVAFRVLDVGNYLSLFLLDSGHSCHVGGMQAAWLKKALAERENRNYKISAYHVGAYPSYYPFSNETSKAIREEWSYLFERYHLTAAFEHHNHTYKRTFPLKAGQIDPDGVVYLGDGSWGISPREPKKMWYLSRREKANAVCVVTLSEKSGEIEALRIDGEKIDGMDLLPTRAYTAFEETKLLERQ